MGFSGAGARAEQSEWGAGAAEDAREKCGLQKAYYGLLHALVHSEVTGALLAAAPATRDAALEALVRGAASHVDPVVRKTCCQVTLGLSFGSESGQ